MWPGSAGEVAEPQSEQQKLQGRASREPSGSTRMESLIHRMRENRFFFFLFLLKKKNLNRTKRIKKINLAARKPLWGKER